MANANDTTVSVSDCCFLFRSQSILHYKLLRNPTPEALKSGVPITPVDCFVRVYFSLFQSLAITHAALHIASEHRNGVWARYIIHFVSRPTDPLRYPPGPTKSRRLATSGGR
jgi:hypothetical protein